MSVEALKEICLKAKNEKAAFQEVRKHKTTQELSTWFSNNYAYDDTKVDPKYKRYMHSPEQAFSNLYFDVINELI